MTPRLAVAAGAALAVLVAGCGGTDAAGPEEPPPAAALVREAQERIRLAGTGRLTVHQVALVDGAELIVTWAGVYDLERHLWSTTGEYELAAETTRFDLVGTADHTFRASPAFGPQYRGKWLLGAAGEDDNTEPHLHALLSFEPGAATERDADGWAVPGRLPMRTVLGLLGVTGQTPGEQERIAGATGSAAARLVLGPDRQVRELRITGGDVDLAGLNLSQTIGDAMRDVAMSIQVGDLGREVAVTEPAAGDVVEDGAGS